MTNFALKVVSLITNLLSLIGYCFKKLFRYRKQKILAEDAVPTSVVVVPSVSSGSPALIESHHYAGNHFLDVQLEENNQEWDSWDDPSSSPSINQESNEVIPEPELDFFKDMEPKVKVNKVLVRKKVNSVMTTDRLAMDQDLDFKVTGELEEWKEEDGWSGDDTDLLDINESEILREAQKQRRLERQSRAKQQRLQKSNKSHDKLGLKVS